MTKAFVQFKAVETPLVRHQIKDNQKQSKIGIKKIVNHVEIVIHANLQLRTVILMLLRLMQLLILALMTLEK